MSKIQTVEMTISGAIAFKWLVKNIDVLLYDSNYEITNWDQLAVKLPKKVCKALNKYADQITTALSSNSKASSCDAVIQAAKVSDLDANASNWDAVIKAAEGNGLEAADILGYIQYKEDPVSAHVQSLYTLIKSFFSPVLSVVLMSTTQINEMTIETAIAFKWLVKNIDQLLGESDDDISNWDQLADKLPEPVLKALQSYSEKINMALQSVELDASPAPS